MKVIPQDLIQEIILRLPVKSLRRFKCVCRSWHDLISDHNFVRAQINHAKTTSHRQLDTFIVSQFGQYKYGIMVYDKRIEEEDDQLSSNPLSFHRLKIPPEFLAGEFRLTGHCDGMHCVCVFTENRTADGGLHLSQSVYLWNPSIHDFKRLHHLDFYDGRNVGFRVAQTHALIEDFKNDVFGIGYNPSIDDYYICRIPARKVRQAEILYLKKPNWKTIGGEQPWCYEVQTGQCPVSFNGNLYCLADVAADDGRASSGRIVLCFNGEKESFEELAPPPNRKEYYLYRLCTAFQDRHLCLITVCRSSLNCGIQFWFYESSSWSCFQRVPYETNRDFDAPLCITSCCIYFVKPSKRSSADYDTRIIKFSFKDETTRAIKLRPVGEIYPHLHYSMLHTLCSPTSLVPNPRISVPI